MTLEECVALLTPLALAMRAEMDKPTYRAYHALLKDVPVQLGQAAIEDLQASGLRFFPAATEIQTAAEKARRRLLALNPYDGCAECEDQPGYRTMRIEGQQKTVEPCPCKARHRVRLADLGVLDPIAMMPGEAEPESGAAYPTPEQIPEPIRARLREMSNAKLLK